MSDVVGLLVVSSLFSRSAEGRRWTEWGVRELGREAEHQVRPDGCDHEASIAYHRLVAELFIVGADAADAVLPGTLPGNVRPTIDAMLAFATDYIRPDGLAPQIGDVDNGRLLPLGDYGSDQRSHLHLYAQARRPYQPPTASAGYRDGGFFILRAGGLYAAVRCGDVGIYGRGCHAHNDLLGFELCYDGTPLVIDPGSFLYTADPAARNLFRSTRMHSTLQIDGAEQNELREDRLFAMVDRASPELLEWTVTADEVRFRGRHHGFSHLVAPAVHTRTLRLLPEEHCLEIEDEVSSSSRHDLEWTFPVGPAAATPTDAGVVVAHGDARLLIDAGGLDASVESGWYSPSYGMRLAGTFVRLRARSEPGAYRHSFRLTVRTDRLGD
jgi:hypothetical protein